MKIRLVSIPSAVMVFSLAFVFCLGSCTSSDSNDTSHLPQSRGGDSDILVIMDSTFWAGDLGETLRQTFSQSIPGLNRAEPLFSLKYVKPQEMNSLLKRSKNILYVTVLGHNSYENRVLKSNFTQESLQKISADPNIFFFDKKNEFAKPQIVLHLFAENSRDLSAKIEQNADQLRQFMLKNVNNRMARAIRKSSNRQMMKVIRDKYGFSLVVPRSYDPVKLEDNFMWIRSLDRDEDKSIYIYREPYTSEAIFEPDSLLKFRNEIGREYVFDAQKPSIYMSTQGEKNNAPLPEITETTFQDSYVKNIRGLWMLSDLSRGGPFNAYVFVDESTNQLYYLEGYIEAPRRDFKRDIMRELEAILNSFTLASETTNDSDSD